MKQALQWEYQCHSKICAYSRKYRKTKIFKEKLRRITLLFWDDYSWLQESVTRVTQVWVCIGLCTRLRFLQSFVIVFDMRHLWMRIFPSWSSQLYLSEILTQVSAFWFWQLSHYKSFILISYSSIRTRTSKINAPANSGSVEGCCLLPRLYFVAVFLNSGRWRGKSVLDHCLQPFYKALIPFMRSDSSWSNLLLKFLPLNTVALGIKLQH